MRTNYRFSIGIHALISAIVLTHIVIPPVSKSDCLACWTLRSVKIKLKCGIKITGYVTWNDLWYDVTGAKEEIPFPENLMKVATETDSVIFVYENLQEIMYPIKSLVTTPVDIKQIRPQNVKKITATHQIYDDEESGAGFIPVVSQKQIDLLRTKPKAQLHFDIALSDTYLMSYDDNYGEEELRQLSNAFTWTEEEKMPNEKIIRISFAYD